MFENGCISCLKIGNRINISRSRKSSVFVFLVVVEIIGGSADWIRTENGGIRTAGCAFRMAAAGNFCDLKRNLVKLKTLSTGVRIFNGAVRTEREFPLKILLLACIRGFSVLLILRNGDQNPLSRSPNTISIDSVSKYFRTFIQSHGTDKFRFSSYGSEYISMLLHQTPGLYSSISCRLR